MANNPPPVTVNSPIPQPGTPLYNAAVGLTNAQINGPLAELARQIALNNRQGAGAERKTAGYFRQLGRFSRGAVGQEKGIANSLNSQLANISNQTQGQLSQFGQQAQQQRGLQGLAGTGLDGGAMANLSAELARQKGLAAQNAGTFRSSGAIQGANFRGLSAQNQGAYALGGQQRLGEIAQATRLSNEPINAKEANLAATRGSLLAANLGKVGQQNIADQFTSRGLGLKDKALNITSQNNLANQSLRKTQINNQLAYQNAEIRIRQINSQLQRGNLTERKRHDLATEKAAQQRIAQQNLPKKTATGAPVAPIGEQNRVFGYIDQARSLIPTMQAPLSQKAADSLKSSGYNVQAGQRLSESQIRSLLAAGIHPGGNTRFNSAEIDAAYALAGYGFLTNKQITELNNMGVIVGTRYKRGTPTKQTNPSNLFGPGGVTGPA